MKKVLVITDSLPETLRLFAAAGKASNGLESIFRGFKNNESRPILSIDINYPDPAKLMSAIGENEIEDGHPLMESAKAIADAVGRESLWHVIGNAAMRELLVPHVCQGIGNMQDTQDTPDNEDRPLTENASGADPGASNESHHTKPTIAKVQEMIDHVTPLAVDPEYTGRSEEHAKPLRLTGNIMISPELLDRITEKKSVKWTTSLLSLVSPVFDVKEKKSEVHAMSQPVEFIVVSAEVFHPLWNISQEQILSLGERQSGVNSEKYEKEAKHVPSEAKEQINAIKELKHTIEACSAILCHGDGQDNTSPIIKMCKILSGIFQEDLQLRQIVFADRTAAAALHYLPVAATKAQNFEAGLAYTYGGGRHLRNLKQTTQLGSFNSRFSYFEGIRKNAVQTVESTLMGLASKYSANFTSGFSSTDGVCAGTKTFSSRRTLATDTTGRKICSDFNSRQRLGLWRAQLDLAEGAATNQNVINDFLSELRKSWRGFNCSTPILCSIYGDDFPVSDQIEWYQTEDHGRNSIWSASETSARQRKPT